MRQSKRRRKRKVDVSVVSGTFNRLGLLQAMVESARESAGDLVLEIVLVDGGSTDGTLDWCTEQRDVVLVEHGELRGAIKAYNDGCAEARGRYVVIGNDDVRFEGETISEAYEFMEQHPEVGQGAFGHRYVARGALEPVVLHASGYLYGQCSIVPRWLGDRAGWWGTEGMRTYGGDTRLSLRLWEMGWPVVPILGCAVTDCEHQDALREANSDTPWRNARGMGAVHPDLAVFNEHWQQRLPARNVWVPAPSRRLLAKAARGNLRTMRFKSGMFVGAPTRTALVDTLAAYGPTLQINQTDKVAELGQARFQDYALSMIGEFAPDLVIFQIQRENNVALATIREAKRHWPAVCLVNWDGDTHPNMPEFHFEVAKAVDLQLVISPSLFRRYAEKGIAVGYWPIGIEQAYADQQRAEVVDGADVVFLGALYGEGLFPEAEFRRDAVLALAASDLQFELHGPGWAKVGLQVSSTAEKHAANAVLYARSKMALSISQSADLWGYTSDRLYNICATGCPALVQRFNGMEHHGFVDGETCIAFKTVDEMIEKAHHYVEYADEREATGAAGRAMTLERHTWAARVPALLAMLEDVR